MMAVIANIVPLSSTIKRLVLRAADGALLPTASAGAHILLHIPGPNRIWKNAYSLVSAPDNRAEYQIIVRRVQNSRGGSAWLHDHAAIGQQIEIGMPVNLFPINHTAPRHLLLSAGIGITPFLCYLPLLAEAGKPYELHHCCKAEDGAAFNALLLGARNVTLHTSRNTLDLAALLGRQKLDTHLYICGPEAFMDVTVATARHLGWPESKIHKESFGGASGGAPFTVKLARSGVTLEVNANQSLLEAIEDAGLNPPCLCRGGACGECELRVIAGVPDHHDHYLSAAQHASNDRIMTCVSRAKTLQLVLDF